MAEFLLLRKPKVVQQNLGPDITFTGLDAETLKVPKKPTPLSQQQSRSSVLPGLEHVPRNSPELGQEIRATKPSTVMAEPPLVNLLDLATVAPKPRPLFTLNDFVQEALASQTMETGLVAPLKSRENFNTFHSTPSGMGRPPLKPVLHVQDVLEDVEIPEASGQRVPKQQKLIEMRAVIREALIDTTEGSEQSLTLASTEDSPVDMLYPYSKSVFCGGLSKFFQGEPRSNSPFFIPEEQMLTVSKAAIFNALKEGARKLSLRAHFIASLPDITPLALTLVELNLSFNNLRVIPTQALHLPNLVILSLRNNPIMQLPTDMTGLPRLAELNLSFCLIHHIPDGFFSLPAIEDLNLSYNHLTKLPSSVANLHTMTSLNLDGNQLSALPFTVMTLSKLQTIRIKNNFTAHAFWSEYSSKGPLSLKDACAKVVVDHEIQYHPYCNDELTQWLDRNVSSCDCCGGTLVGQGLVLVRSVMDKTFGVRNLPLSLRSCSLPCFYEYRKMRNLDVGDGSQSSLHGTTLQQLTSSEN